MMNRRYVTQVRVTGWRYLLPQKVAKKSGQRMSRTLSAAVRGMSLGIKTLIGCG
jgi:hypothetical protein